MVNFMCTHRVILLHVYFTYTTAYNIFSEFWIAFCCFLIYVPLLEQYILVASLSFVVQVIFIV